MIKSDYIMVINSVMVIDGGYEILVGGMPTHLKEYELVNWDDEIPN